MERKKCDLEFAWKRFCGYPLYVCWSLSYTYRVASESTREHVRPFSFPDCGESHNLCVLMPFS